MNFKETTGTHPPTAGEDVRADPTGSGSWIGPILLAAAPFAFFAALLALDRLLP